jgi:hypothetical protein
MRLLRPNSSESDPGMTHVRYVPSPDDETIANWGSNLNPSGVLDPAHEYEVEDVVVHSSHTKVWLVDFGGPFNSVHFEPEPV